MNIATHTFEATSIIALDFSGFDITGLDCGDAAAISALIDYLGRVRAAIDGFVPGQHQRQPLLFAWGFPASGLSPSGDPPRGGAPVRRWFFDELVDARQSLREAFLRSSIWTVPSVYLGSSDCTSPAVELMSLFQSRLWLNDHSFFYGMPSHWSHDLLQQDPFFGSSGMPETLAHGWQLSVESAQKTGLVDGSLAIPGFADDPGRHLPLLVDRLAPALMARQRSISGSLQELGSPAFRDAVAIATRRFTRSASDSARALHKSLQPDEYSSAEREVARIYRCLNGERERLVRSRQKNSQVLQVYSPQMFGFFVDLAIDVMPAELLTAAVARKGLALLTSSDPAVLVARLEKQRQILVTLMGNAKAQAFWERNIIPLAGGSDFFAGTPALPVISPRTPADAGTMEWDIEVPSEGRFLLTLLPQIAARARSDEAFSGLVVGELSGDIDAWLASGASAVELPELVSILRALVDGVLLKPSVRPLQIRDLFHVMLAAYVTSLGHQIDAVWQSLAETGWSLDDPATVRAKLAETLGSHHDILRSAGGRDKAQREKVTPVFSNHVAWALLAVLQDKLAVNGVARELVRDIAGAPCTMLVGVDGDEAAPSIHRVHMTRGSSEEAFLSFVPWPASERWHHKPGRQQEYPVGVSARRAAVKDQVSQFVSTLTQPAGQSVGQFPLLLGILAPEALLK